MKKLYETDRKSQVAIKPTKQFLQDMNLIMATMRMDASDVIRQSVHAQAEAIRREFSEAWAIALEKGKGK